MTLGVFAVILLVVINTALMVGVMYVGSKHDAHTSIRSVESSKAAQLMAEGNQAMAASLEARMTSAQETAKSGKKAEAGASILGDEDEKAKRRAAALARKQARQANK